MWETSNRDAWFRQCLVASMIESPYWIGIDQPAKGTILPGGGAGGRGGGGGWAVSPPPAVGIVATGQRGAGPRGEVGGRRRGASPLGRAREWWVRSPPRPLSTPSTLSTHPPTSILHVQVVERRAQQPRVARQRARARSCQRAASAGAGQRAAGQQGGAGEHDVEWGGMCAEGGAERGRVSTRSLGAPTPPPRRAALPPCATRRPSRRADAPASSGVVAAPVEPFGVDAPARRGRRRGAMAAAVELFRSEEMELMQVGRVGERRGRARRAGGIARGPSRAEAPRASRCRAATRTDRGRAPRRRQRAGVQKTHPDPAPPPLSSQLLVPADAAHAAASALGALGAAQLQDMNAGRPAFQRPFASHVKRCDEMARAVRVLDAALSSAGRAPRPAAAPDASPLDELEARLADLEARLGEAAASRERLARAVAELVELRLVLDVAASFFSDARRAAGGAVGSGGSAPPPPPGPPAPLLAAAPPAPDAGGRRLGFVAGTVPDARRAGFERLLFRATRGNLLYKDAPVGPVADPASGDVAPKSVFVVFFAGERARAKALKICEACGANRYPYPDDAPRAAAMAAEVDARLRELQAAVDAGDAGRGGLLGAVEAGIASWRARVATEKAVYAALDQFSVDVTRKVLVGQAWVPTRQRAALAAALRAAAPRGSGAALAPLLTFAPPPTHFATDKVTACFQAIVDAYGVARYREANPALLTIVTFPFLFAVMFGDVGHALLMLLGAGALVAFEGRLSRTVLGDMGDMVFAGRAEEGGREIGARARARQATPGPQPHPTSPHLQAGTASCSWLSSPSSPGASTTSFSRSRCRSLAAAAGRARRTRPSQTRGACGTTRPCAPPPSPKGWPRRAARTASASTPRGTARGPSSSSSTRSR